MSRSSPSPILDVAPAVLAHPCSFSVLLTIPAPLPKLLALPPPPLMSALRAELVAEQGENTGSGGRSVGLKRDLGQVTEPCSLIPVCDTGVLLKLTAPHVIVGKPGEAICPEGTLKKM